MAARLAMTVVAAVAYTALLLILLYTAATPERKQKYYVPVKMVCSASFLFIGFVFAHAAAAYDVFFGWLPGLVFCFFGDLFMGLYNILRKKRFIILGIATFLAAHICFLVHLVKVSEPKTGVSFILPWLVPLIGVTALEIFVRKFHLHLGRVRIPALIYSYFVTAFMVRSVISGNALIAFGGVLFFLSDLLLAFLYFYYFKSKKVERAFHVLNLLTYYYGIFLILVSVL